jgi:hypothetical protein
MRLLSLALALTLLAAWPAAAKTSLPTFKVGSDYEVARGELLKRGFTPVHVPGQDQEDCLDHRENRICERFPEVWGCEQRNGEPCDFVWRAPDGSLMLISAGYAPQFLLAIYEPGPRRATKLEQRLMYHPPRSDLPQFKRHMPYGEVRAELLKRGFKPLLLSEPLSPDCTPYGDRCTIWPELESCTAAGVELCTFGWRAPNGRWVRVGSVGEEPPGFYAIEYADRDVVSRFKHQMVERQTYRPYDP